MKIGLVLECTLGGADLQVYSYFLRHFLGETVEIEPSCAGNKKILIQEVGTRTRALLAQKCERVLIIWDRWPRWSEGGADPDLAQDIAAITQTLREAEITEPCVFLIGIDRMLETLLIVDGNAIAQVLGITRNKPKHRRSPTHVHKPKDYLDGLFREYRREPYADYRHAIRIAQCIDVTRLANACPEFVRFGDSLSQRPCRPPLAWARRP